MSATADEVARQDDGLFDGEAYRVPFPQADGKEVDELVLRLSGSLKLNRHHPDDVALIEGLRLGRHVTLLVSASVDGKSQSVKVDQEGQETVTHAVGLRMHSVEPTES
jgi:hypothetical protein